MRALQQIQNKWQWSEGADEPRLAAGQVKIAVHYAAMNRADLMQMAGQYPPPPGASEIPGLEVSGEVIATADDVVDVKVGEKVAALLEGGGYAEYVCVDVRQVVKVPETWSMAHAAGWLEVFSTAFLNVFMLAQLQPQEKVFCHAGASGVGSALIQLCRAAGNDIAVTVSNDEKAAVCRELGASEIINRHQQDYTEVLSQKPVDVILNPVAGDSIARDQTILNADGRILLIGLMQARTGEIDFGRLLMKRQRLQGSTLRSLSHQRKGEIIAALMQRFGEDFQSGALMPLIDEIYPMREVGEALNRLKQSATMGKLILAVRS
ncbi:NADPH:quinone reductase [Idiomarina tyrosinivorans]|uniref:NADPH:quinone reductase n=1 Tax=Idiomarina tyrosinivorans TaxID=1445662 RepID=A0A432ZRW7_9GAMM|nr:NAD(P)H-quinone oxidoreductase [Idiomarina tyrosinivorans]RUO80578.1 NADPH:quinone reductase [Idiomarina tyrosinivorans]